MTEKACAALQIDLEDGRRIWVPPVGRPFWAHVPTTRSLTDDELKEFGLVKPVQSPQD
jgi:hypothetical protein